MKIGILLFTFVLTACSHLFYHPQKTILITPERLSLTWKEYKFQAKDETRLVGWWITATKQPAKGTVVQFHGNGHNISGQFLYLSWMVDAGYNLFVFDYRGYGNSEGNPDPEGTVQDGVAALDFAWKLHSDSKAQKFVVIGQSLGGVVALRSLQDSKLADQVDLVVLDSTFHSYQDISRRTLGKHWLTWLFQPLGCILISDRYVGTQYMANHRAPFLILHDKKDPLVPFECGQMIFDKSKEPKEFWAIDEGRHVSTFRPEHPENQLRFLNYLDALKNPAAAPAR